MTVCHFKLFKKGVWRLDSMDSTSFFSVSAEKNVPIMPCSCSKHARLRFRGQLLGPQLVVQGVLGSGERIIRPELSNVRERTCSIINSYFDPSVRSDWGSLMSICLAGISLAPGNPTGFLRIGEGFEGCLIRHTLSGSTSEGETQGGSGCCCVCMCCFFVLFF